MQPSLFIFGLGYSSQAIAALALKNSFRVAGTTRDEKKAEAFRALGIHAQTNFVLPEAVTHILSSIPPQEIGDIVLPHVGDALWLGYLSTTGVYGDWGGAWVDESSELRPTSERLKRRVEAESAWRERGGHVFRLAGIYGPGRSVIEDIREGAARRIDKEGQVFSRIHVADIAQTVVASMQRPNPGSAYNVCDDEPAPAHEVVAYGCKILGVAPPPLIPFAEADLSPMGREFYAANRRVNNSKIKEELGVSLYYPTYREGLSQCSQLAQSLQ
jgi:hypothetical protein